MMIVWVAGMIIWIVGCINSNVSDEGVSILLAPLWPIIVPIGVIFWLYQKYQTK